MLHLQQLTQNYGVLMQVLESWQELPLLSFSPTWQHPVVAVPIIPKEQPIPIAEALYRSNGNLGVVQQLQKLLALLGHGYTTRLQDILPALERFCMNQEYLSLESVEYCVAELQQMYGEQALLEDVVVDLVDREVCS